MTVTVVLPSQLAEQAGGQERFEVDGPTVEAALQALPVAHLILAAGALRPEVRVRVDGTDIRERDGLDTVLADGAEVRVVAAAARDG